MKEASARKSKIALGLAIVQLLFIGETAVAHRQMPNPASPLVWTLLGSGAMVCLGLAMWFHRKARRG